MFHYKAVLQILEENKIILSLNYSQSFKHIFFPILGHTPVPKLAENLRPS